MNEKIFDALTALAAKLGTTAELLWGVLIKQAHISAAINLTWGALCLVALIISSAWFFKNIARWSEPWRDDGNGEYVAYAWMGYLGVSATLFGGAGACLTAAASVLMNPEYWALRKILSAL